MRKHLSSNLVRLAIVAIAYYLAAEVGLGLALVGRSVTPLWPPTGLAVVAFLAWGRRMWPAVAVAALAVNLPLGPPVSASVAIAVGNTLAPLAAAVLLQRVDFHRELDRIRDAVALVSLGALGSMAVSATIGTLALLAVGSIGTGKVLDTWSVWWTGDAMGVLIVAPFLWCLRDTRVHVPSARAAVQAAAGAALLVGTCAFVFSTTPSLGFLVLPILGVIAWRYHQRGAAPAALLVSVVATWSAANGFGPFAGESLLQKMIALQSLNATVALTAVFVASAVIQRERLAAHEHRTAVDLQRSLLPALAREIGGAAVATRYLPAGTGLEIGGDWYDVIPLGGGRLGLAVGDVAGHGTRAAAVMGEVRIALRVYAREGLAPADAVGRLSRLIFDAEPSTIVTLWYGVYDPSSRQLRFTSAGHFPPLLVGSDRTSRYVEELRAAPLGVVPEIAYPELSCTVDAGAAILLYTDGLIERRHVPIDASLRRMESAVERGPRDLEQLCDHVVRELVDGVPEDDVAVLAVRPTSTDAGLRGPGSPATIAGSGA